MGGYSDRDSGGWIPSELEQNIEYCAEEKAQKIIEYKARYGEWWLVLVDQIAFAMDKFDRDLWRDRTVPLHGWDKIVLPDPRGQNKPLEI